MVEIWEEEYEGETYKVSVKDLSVCVAKLPANFEPLAKDLIRAVRRDVVSRHKWVELAKHMRPYFKDRASPLAEDVQVSLRALVVLGLSDESEASYNLDKDLLPKKRKRTPAQQEACDRCDRTKEYVRKTVSRLNDYCFNPPSIVFERPQPEPKPTASAVAEADEESDDSTFSHRSTASIKKRKLGPKVAVLAEKFEGIALGTIAEPKDGVCSTPAVEFRIKHTTEDQLISTRKLVGECVSMAMPLAPELKELADKELSEEGPRGDTLIQRTYKLVKFLVVVFDEDGVQTGDWVEHEEEG